MSKPLSCRSCGKELGTTSHCDECQTYGKSAAADKTAQEGMTKLQARQVTLANEISAMSDDQIRYQVKAHERHNDYSWTFDLFLAEYRKRGLREHGDWQDEGERRMGA